MCKQGIAVEVNGQPGRIDRLRKEKDQVIGDFTDRGCQNSRIVNLNQVKPSHKKAEKNLSAELQKIGVNGATGINGQKNKTLHLSQRPGDKVRPRAMYA